MSAAVVIAADGRRSAIAWGWVSRGIQRVRGAWAIGAYFENFGVSPRHNSVVLGSDPEAYLAVRGSDPMARGDTGRDACTQKLLHRRRAGAGGLDQRLSRQTLRTRGRRPARPVRASLRELADDPLLRDRAARARFAGPPVVLGPLAVDVDPPSLDGLLLAGDAAGFIDPMTGDGLRFAVRGGELAARRRSTRLRTAGPASTRAWLRRAGARSPASGASTARCRALVASPRAVDLATLGGGLAPRAFERL
jgi:hypothetical protein